MVVWLTVRAGQGGKKDADQERDDRDDHEEFEEGEGGGVTGCAGHEGSFGSAEAQCSLLADGTNARGPLRSGRLWTTLRIRTGG